LPHALIVCPYHDCGSHLYEHQTEMCPCGKDRQRPRSRETGKTTRRAFWGTWKQTTCEKRIVGDRLRILRYFSVVFIVQRQGVLLRLR